jgi:transposase
VNADTGEASSGDGAEGAPLPAKRKRQRRKELPDLATLNASSQRRVCKKIKLSEIVISAVTTSFAKEGRAANPQSVLRAMQLVTGQQANKVNHRRGAVSATLGASERRERVSNIEEKKVISPFL